MRMFVGFPWDDFASSDGANCATGTAAHLSFVLQNAPPSPIVARTKHRPKAMKKREKKRRAAE
jgi:hypothetical protein